MSETTWQHVFLSADCLHGKLSVSYLLTGRFLDLLPYKSDRYGNLKQWKWERFEIDLWDPYEIFTIYW